MSKLGISNGGCFAYLPENCICGTCIFNSLPKLALFHTRLKNDLECYPLIFSLKIRSSNCLKAEQPGLPQKACSELFKYQCILTNKKFEINDLALWKQPLKPSSSRKLPFD